MSSYEGKFFNLSNLVRLANNVANIVMSLHSVFTKMWQVFVSFSKPHL